MSGYRVKFNFTLTKQHYSFILYKDSSRKLCIWNKQSNVDAKIPIMGVTLAKLTACLRFLSVVLDK
jgi:ABC-type Fe2+-enterobactin transport system substrate-binding protein